MAIKQESDFEIARRAGSNIMQQSAALHEFISRFNEAFVEHMGKLREAGPLSDNQMRQFSAYLRTNAKNNDVYKDIMKEYQSLLTTPGRSTAKFLELVETVRKNNMDQLRQVMDMFEADHPLRNEAAELYILLVSPTQAKDTHDNGTQAKPLALN